MKYFIGILFIIEIFLSTNSLEAQIKMEPSFLQTLEIAHISFSEPVENLYKNVKRTRNSIINCDLAIKKEEGGYGNPVSD